MVEYIVAIDVTRVRFPADAFHLLGAIFNCAKIWCVVMLLCRGAAAPCRIYFRNMLRSRLASFRRGCENNDVPSPAKWTTNWSSGAAAEDQRPLAAHPCNRKSFSDSQTLGKSKDVRSTHLHICASIPCKSSYVMISLSWVLLLTHRASKLYVHARAQRLTQHLM